MTRKILEGNDMAILAFAAVLVLAVIISILSRRGVIRGNISDVLVASGTFGPVLIFFIMVGENYTTGTLLGVPGTISAVGARYGFWFIGYILLAYPIAYFLSPAIWRMGRLSGGATIGDILGWRYASRMVEIVVAVISIIFLLPIIQMQLRALSIALIYLEMNTSFALGVILAAILAYVMILISGIRAPAYVSILKDTLLILEILLVGIVCIMKTDGGVRGIFTTLKDTIPDMLMIPKDYYSEVVFVMFSVFFMMLTLNIYPVLVAGTLTSSSEKNLRKSIIIMPLYMLMFPFLVICAYFALVNFEELSHDTSLFAVITRYLPQWIVGIIAGGVALTAILVISVNALAIAGLFSKNFFKVLKPKASEKELILTVRIVTFVSLALSAILAIVFPDLLANILRLSYMGMSQLLVAIFFAFFWKNASPLGIVVGLVVGLVLGLLYQLFETIHGQLFGIPGGLISLTINFMFAIIFSQIPVCGYNAVVRFYEYKAVTPWTFLKKSQNAEKSQVELSKN
jgi:SSS family solute:Na+ symporter